MKDGSLAGCRILIVEDEYYLAQDLALTLRDHGAVVLGPVGTIGEAAQMVRDERFDCAVVDMNLRGESSEPLADALRNSSVPTLIVSGYSRQALPDDLQASEYLEKPASSAAVVAAVSRLVAS